MSGLPGGGPRHRGRCAGLRAGRRSWTAWYAVAAVAGVVAVGVVPATVDGGAGIALVIVLVLAVAGALTVGATRRWHERHDRTEDDVRRYAPGVPVGLDLDEAMDAPHDPSGRLWLDGQEVARLDRPDDHPADHPAHDSAADHPAHDGAAAHPAHDPADAPPTLTVDGTPLRLEACVGPDGTLAVRLCDTDGTPRAQAHGERRGGLVDWVFPGDPELRLRQRLAALPTRRTLLAADGRAWLVRADHAANRWRGELPPGSTALRAALVLWTCAYLDRVGIAHAYPADRRPIWFPSVEAPYLLTSPVGRWVRVGGPVRRPEPPEGPAS